MRLGESCHRTCAMQPMRTMLSEHRSTEMTAATQGPGRVLVVDDDEITRRLTAANFALEGFDVATAVDGQDCMDKALAIMPDVITLDVTMLRPDGWEIALRLRKCPGTSPIKVVLMTSHDQAASPTQQSHADADAYLAKPFDPGEMIRVVRGLAGAKGVGA
jgi:CheY-like chemotaxis protein